jgi:hypothetical protein
MQTTGAALLAAKRCTPMRVLILAQDSRSAHGLLYLTAVRGDICPPEHCHAPVDTYVSLDRLTAPEAVGR